MTPAAPARPARLAADVARPLALSDEAKGLLAPAATARQFFDALVGAALPEDAIRFLAAALPKREAVWWGLSCVKDRIPKPAPAPAAALAAAERWVKDPSEANRRAAGDAAPLAGYGTPAGCLAAGAFWSGGSLAPPNLPPVPPRDDLTGQAVAGALLLSAVADPPTAAAARQQFLALGADLAAGKVRV